MNGLQVATGEPIIDPLPECLGNLVLPTAYQCQALDGELLRAAVKNGYTAVHHPIMEGIFLLLWMTQVWKWANVLVTVNAHTFWPGKITWLTETDTREGRSFSLRARTIHALKSSPWQSEFSNNQCGSVLASHLATFLYQMINGLMAMS